MKSAQDPKLLAKQIARQIAQEPLEILKNAREQVAPQEIPQTTEPPKEKTESKMPVEDKIKIGRRMEALNRELEDIHKQDVFKDLQRKIAEGEEVPLEDYAELSMEQKQVLKAQMEAVKAQKNAQASQVSEVPSPSSKPSRRFGAGQKQAAQKEQTRVEKPVPPSG